MYQKPRIASLFSRCCALSLGFAALHASAQLPLQDGDTVYLIGNGLADRMQHDGWVETLIQSELLDDKEAAAVLTYVRNSWGNKASSVKPEAVRKVHAATQDRDAFYKPEELLKEHPMK